MANHQAAYGAVYAYIDKIGVALPSDTARRNAMIWTAVQAALEAEGPTVDAVNAVARVRELHRREQITTHIAVCSHCYGPYAGDTVPWPCPTIRAIDGSDDE